MPEFNYAKGRINDSMQFIATEIKEFEDDYISMEKSRGRSFGIKEKIG